MIDVESEPPPPPPTRQHSEVQQRLIVIGLLLLIPVLLRLDVLLGAVRLRPVYAGVSALVLVVLLMIAIRMFMSIHLLVGVVMIVVLGCTFITLPMLTYYQQVAVIDVFGITLSTDWTRTFASLFAPQLLPVAFVVAFAGWYRERLRPGTFKARDIRAIMLAVLVFLFFYVMGVAMEHSFRALTVRDAQTVGIRQYYLMQFENYHPTRVNETGLALFDCNALSLNCEMALYLPVHTRRYELAHDLVDLRVVDDDYLSVRVNGASVGRYPLGG